MKKTFVDANYILRWFLNDIPEQSKIASKLIQHAKEGELALDRVTIAEITYVLRAHGYDHQQIFTLFQELYYYPAFSAAADVDWRAIKLFKQTTLDFEDCLLVAHHQIDGAHVATFDKDILKALQA